MIADSTLEARLFTLDERASRAVEIHDPCERYRALQLVQVDVMKLRVQYDVGSEEERRILRRQGWYSSLMHKAQCEANRMAQIRSGSPFVVVQFDEVGVIVADQEAVAANAEIVRRHLAREALLAGSHYVSGPKIDLIF